MVFFLNFFRFRHGFVKLFCCCPCRLCAKCKDRSKPGMLPVTLFRNSSNTYAMTDHHQGNGCSTYTTTESVDDASSSPVNHKKGRRNSAEYLWILLRNTYHIYSMFSSGLRSEFGITETLLEIYFIFTYKWKNALLILRRFQDVAIHKYL